jgi:7-cyano-7-deazaguanine synthase
MAEKRAVVLLSGGLDSATTAAVAKAEGFALYALSFDYGQRHRAELAAAQRLATMLGAAEHKIATIDLRIFGGSALTGDLDVPKGRITSEMRECIPVTYVPGRNTIFLSYAVAWAEVLCANDVFIGVNAVDYSGYPDCRPEYIAAFEHLANLATKVGVEGTTRLSIRTPLISMTKAQIIRTGLQHGVDYSATLTCYDPTPVGEACGECDSCRIRLEGFAAAGYSDPAAYVMSSAV